MRSDGRVVKNRGIVEQRQFQALSLVHDHQDQVELRRSRLPGKMGRLKISDFERGQGVVFTAQSSR